MNSQEQPFQLCEFDFCFLPHLIGFPLSLDHHGLQPIANRSSEEYKIIREKGCLSTHHKNHSIEIFLLLKYQSNWPFIANIYRDLGANIVSSMDFFIESAREAATLLSASFSSLS